MSTALLLELHQEVKRLYIAGSDLAAEDYRLKRLLPQFQQLGERASIFKRLGEGIAAVIEPNPTEALSTVQQLQDLNMLLSSVLHTQGVTKPEGELREVCSRPLSLSTNLSYRKLNAVQEALTTSGSGRYEIVKEAFEAGMFQDLRLVQLAIEALNDPYSEIADMVMRDILPSYGPQILPLITKDLDPSGGRKEARKLNVIAAVGGSEVLELIYQAAESGSDEVRVTAIQQLAGHEQYEAELLRWSKDKRKSIREAAYQALAESGWTNAVLRLYEAFSSKDKELVVPALRKCQSGELTKQLVEALAAELKSAEDMQDNKAKLDEIWDQVRLCLQTLYDKTTPELKKLFISVLQQYSFYMNKLGWSHLIDKAMNYLVNEGSEEARELVRSTVERNIIYYRNSNQYLHDVFKDAYAHLSPARVFEQYGEILQGQAHAVNRKSTKESERLLSTILDIVSFRRYKQFPKPWGSSADQSIYTYVVEMIPPHIIEMQWDPRWLDLFIQHDQYELVSVFARPGHQEAERYLLRKIQNNPEFRNRFFNVLLMGLERAGVSTNDRQELLMNALEDERNSKCTLIEPYTMQELCGLSASYADRIRAVLPKFSDEAEDQLHYVIRMMQK
ncbi:HEAT repeat domain-containing protein [Paenibacillus marinisediminis]